MTSPAMGPTVAEIKESLDNLGVSYKATMRKGELAALLEVCQVNLHPLFSILRTSLHTSLCTSLCTSGSLRTIFLTIYCNGFISSFSRHTMHHFTHHFTDNSHHACHFTTSTTNMILLQHLSSCSHGSPLATPASWAGWPLFPSLHQTQSEYTLITIYL